MIHVCRDADIKLQTNIAIGHNLAWVVNSDTTILLKLDSIQTQLFDIGAWWTLRVYIALSDGTKRIGRDATLRKLNFAPKFRYHSSGICLSGTREELIGGITYNRASVRCDVRSISMSKQSYI